MQGNTWSGSAPEPETLGDGVISFQLDREDTASLNAVPGREHPDVKAANIVKAYLRRLRRRTGRRTRAQQMFAQSRVPR